MKRLQGPDGREISTDKSSREKSKIMIDTLDAIGNFIDALASTKAAYLRTVLNLRNGYELDLMDDGFRLGTKTNVLKVYATIKLHFTAEKREIIFCDFAAEKHVFSFNKLPDLIGCIDTKIIEFKPLRQFKKGREIFRIPRLSVGEAG
jgi:hypothetical protein